MSANPTPSTSLGVFTVSRVESPVFQITEHIRNLIQNQELRVGMRLPSTQQLASQLNADPSAVHRSLAKLVKEGLLLRTPRVGTFVAEPPSKLERLAFYYRPIGGAFGPFDRAVLTEISSIGHQKGFSVEVYSDTRTPEISSNEPHPELIRHARSRWVQGVVSSSVSPEKVRWYNSLPIPHATISTPNQPHTFNWERELTVEKAITQLHARGCRKIGMFSALRMHEKDADATPYELGHYHGFRKALAKFNLPYHEEWTMGQAPGAKPVQESEMAALGFEAFNKMWQQSSDRPDGLFLYPDVLATGVLMAIALQSIRVPEDLKLVVHANVEVPLFCPFPIDRLLVSAADAASALVDHVMAQLANRETPQRTLPIRLEPSN